MPVASHARLPGSNVDRAQSRFDAVNAGLARKTRGLLDRVAGDEALQPRLLNTLSMLEHMGSHRIMATQHGAAVGQATLRHLAEECQHAFFMKRQAEKAAGRALEYSAGDLLAPEAARRYFRRLEISLFRMLDRDSTGSGSGSGSGSGTCCYLYMSLIVEFRAVWFYSLLQQALARAGHGLSLKRLLGEEQNHLTDMANRLEHAGEWSSARVERFVQVEHTLYEHLLGSLQLSAA
jgi:hypothetical protein